MPTDQTIHVIDDDDAARDSLAFLLQSADLNVVTYDSAKSFISSLPKANAGCVITDVRMPGMSGVDLLRRLKELGIEIPIIVITGHGDVQLAVEAMKTGAVDFLEKPFDDEVMLASVRTALSKRERATHHDAERLALHERLAALSSREREVLEGLVEGHPNKVIAFNLGISPRTVEIYRANVMTKMKAESLSELVRLALVSGMLKPDIGA